jgi:hypothetical protein
MPTIDVTRRAPGEATRSTDPLGRIAAMSGDRRVRRLAMAGTDSPADALAEIARVARDTRVRAVAAEALSAGEAR